MSTDLNEAREEVTERRPLRAIGAASNPALANSLARLARLDKRPARPLLRVPRASVPPPAASGAETQLSPAPIFDDEVELLEDSGLLVLDSDHADMVEELSARFLIDEESQKIIPLNASSKISTDEVDALDELDSGNLAYVETKGEIERPKIRLLSLHEQALAEGIAQYSDGVPTHALARSEQFLGTLRVRMPRGQSTASKVWRHLPVILVFAAGTFAGVFFAIRSSGPSKAAQAVPVATAATSTESPFSSPRAAQADVATPSAAPAPIVLPLREEAIEVAPVPPLETPTIAASHTEELGATSIEEQATTRERDEASPKRRSRATRTKSAAQPSPSSADPGVLMLAAKPPCSIRIDGKDTGLVTPQRALQLSPGKHKIMLVNEEHSLKDSFVVSIRSGQSTKIIRDITSKIE